MSVRDHPYVVAGALILALATPVLGTAPEQSLRPKARAVESGAAGDDGLSFGKAVAPATPTTPTTPAPEEATGLEAKDTADQASEPASPPADPESAETSPAPAPAEPPLPQTVAGTPAERAACLKQLSDIGAVFTPVPAVSDDDNPDCGILHPIEVSALGEGVALAPPATLRCATALAAAEWVRDWLIPAAATLPELGALREVRHGSAYVCRARSSGGRLSEHALGNALDIMSLEFENAVLDIEPRSDTGDRREALQRTLRAAACLNFTTVIGPGTDEAHADHLHLDIKKRSRDYRLCQ